MFGQSCGSPVSKAKPCGDEWSAIEIAYPTTPSFHPWPATTSRSFSVERYLHILQNGTLRHSAHTRAACSSTTCKSVSRNANVPNNASAFSLRRSLSICSVSEKVRDIEIILDPTLHSRHSELLCTRRRSCFH